MLISGRMTLGLAGTLLLLPLLSHRLVAALPSPNTTDTTETEARCESRCGDDSGSPALCRYFCANSEVQPLTVYRNTEFKEGVENLLSLLDWMEHTLSLSKQQELDQLIQAEEEYIKKIERIVGGSQARRGQFPFAASLKIKGYSRYLHFCGGSAISDIYIITAAHCVVDVKIQKLWVAVGDHDTRVQDTNERVIQADKIIIHIRYNPNNFHNDIALIKLKKSFRPHNMRQTIPLMSDPRRLERELQQNSRFKTTVLGWGTMREGGRPAKILRYVELPYVSLKECRRAMRPHRIYDSMVCAGYVKYGGKDACQGDSGGPLVFRVRKSARNDTNTAVNTTESRVTVREGKTFLFDINDEIGDLLNTSDDYEDNYDYTNEVGDRLNDPHEYVLAGLVSWGVGCAKPKYAGVYTNVASYREWIDKNMKYN